MSNENCGNLNRVRIHKTTLIDEITKNREQHKKDYDAAVSVYHSELAKALKAKQKELKKAEPGTLISSSLDLVKPVNYLEDYDRVIRMLQMTVDEVISLEQHEFNQYVLDQWSWQKNFAAVTKSYSSSGRN